jgi:geranylgeranyl diphosphate synthase type II
MEATRSIVSARLHDIVVAQGSAPTNIREALAYAILDGGKRLRPLLCMWTHDALDGKRGEACLDVACALECLHNYSLVHDDLPCMDNDDMRRGRPSCHRKFGEAVAVLTGDALLTLCFEIISNLDLRWGIEGPLVQDTARVIAAAAGTRGLITGQALDLVSDTALRDLAGVDRIHRHKTAALISASMTAGAIMAGAGEAVRSRVAAAGEKVGIAFQIIDDVLDLEGDGEQLGKTPGKDARTGKLTYPSIVGVEASRRRAADLIEEAKSELGDVVLGRPLGKLLDRMALRSH